MPIIVQIKAQIVQIFQTQYIGTYTNRDALGNQLVQRFFSLKGKDGLLPVSLPEGSCENLLDGKPVMVEEGLISSRGEPVLLKI